MKKETELKEEIEKKLNLFKKKQGIKGKQKFQKLLDSEIVFFVQNLLTEATQEIIEIADGLSRVMLLPHNKKKVIAIELKELTQKLNQEKKNDMY